MSDKSDLILCALLALFFLAFMFRLPDGVWSDLDKGEQSFSSIATNYKGTPAVQDIEPAAGDESPVNAPSSALETE